MSEHRRKPPQPQGGGRAAARRGQSGSSSGRRAAPRGATGSPADYGLGQGSIDEERSHSGRAEAAARHREVEAAAAERPSPAAGVAAARRHPGEDGQPVPPVSGSSTIRVRASTAPLAGCRRGDW